MEEFVDIDLRRFLDALLRRWWIVALSTFLVGIITLLYTLFFITPMYRTSISVYVNNNTNRPSSDTITSSDLVASQRLVNTYIAIITSNTVLEQVSKNLNGSYEPDDIRRMMSCTTVKDTEIFQVSISNKNAEVAAWIANSIADVAPEMIVDFLEGSSVKIIDYASVPEGPYSPSKRRNTLLGLLVGLFLSGFVVILIDVLDTRIKSEEDLEKLSDVPILGVIPNFTQSQSGAYGYSSGKYGYGYGYGSSHREGGEKRSEDTVLKSSQKKSKTKKKSSI